MKLQTTVPVSRESNKIDYTSKVLLLGSCFAESMGERLEYFKFRNLQNPFGVIFNPISISRLIERAISGERFSTTDLLEREGQWFCFEAHSMITATAKDDMLGLLNSRLELLKEYLETATHIVFTYGTSWVYRYKADDKIVANCHKLSQKEFTKELLSVSEIENTMKATFDSVKKINKDVSVIGTISPVRHLKDGFVENTLSKARLIEAIHKVPGFHYFPSYEIMMDELRDYRFYEKDLLHPNETAIQIIWERFNSVWVASETDALQKEIDSIQKGLQHRPFVPDSDAHRAFQNQLRNKIKAISEKLPHINFDGGK